MMTGANQNDQKLVRTVPLQGSPLLELPRTARARLLVGRSLNRPLTRCPAPEPIPASTATGRGANVCACRSPIAGPLDHRAVTDRGANVCVDAARPAAPVPSPDVFLGVQTCARRRPTTGVFAAEHNPRHPLARRGAAGRGANVCATLRSIASSRARSGCFPRGANVCAGCRPACQYLRRERRMIDVPERRPRGTRDVTDSAI